MRLASRTITITLGTLAAVAAVAAAHDLFLRPRAFFLAPGAAAHIDVLNGTFDKSESALAFNRLTDMRIVGPSGTTRPDSTAWHVHGDSADLTWAAGPAGTYVIGAAVGPREIALTADEFNAYLKEDGVPDVLAARRAEGELGKPARERYAKNVKTLLQVGDARTPSFATVFGHPAELVPLENPYTVRIGGALHLRALVDGKPIAGQAVLAGGVTASGARIAETTVRTNADGVATVTISTAGHWYVKFIHMVKATDDATIDYRSKWATITFGAR